MQTKIFILSAPHNGSRVYYTGRAGSGFVSPERSEAFKGFNELGAKMKCQRMNLNSKQFRFEIEPLETT